MAAKRMNWLRGKRCIADWLDTFPNSGTRRAYAGDLRRLAEATEFEDANELAAYLLGSELDRKGARQALRSVFDQWRAESFSPSYINHHLSAMNSFLQFTRANGGTDIVLDIEGEKIAKRPPSERCNHGDLKRLLVLARAQHDSHRSARDESLIRVMLELRLRYAEISDLRVSDYHIEEQVLSVSGKPKKVSPELAACLGEWMRFKRYADPGCRIFTKAVACSAPLSESGVRDILRRLAEPAGISILPSDLRRSQPLICSACGQETPAPIA